jgi:hypothetical protein
MPRALNVLVYILAWLVPALLVAALVTLFIYFGRPRPVETHAPAWLKELTDTGEVPPRRWREIVVHHSAGEYGNLEFIDRVHRDERGWRMAGYHFIIGNGTGSADGEIEAGPRWLTQEIGSHCRGHNRTAIGICLVGNFDVEGHRPSEAQLHAAAQLTAQLALVFEIPRQSILVHREIDGALTACPGRHFPIDGFYRLVEVYIREYE